MKPEFLVPIIVAFLTSEIWRIILPKLLDWKNRKEIAEGKRAQARDDQREHDRDVWMTNSERAYKRVEDECDKCRRELERVRRDNAAAIERLKRDEIEPLKRDNAAIKEALLDRIEALDEIIPYITHLPEEKVSELRRVNRAQRTAVLRGGWQ
jgi:biopolymer transport protein ExbB/TolQ